MVWDLRGREPHHQATLPHPSAHLVVEEGGAWLLRAAARALRAHAGRPRAARSGSASGRAACGRCCGAPVSSIRDRRLPASALPGLDGEALTRAVESAGELEQAVAAMEAALEPLLPAEPDPEIALADRAVALLEEDRSLTRVSDLAERLSLSVRSVQRLFADHVGLGPSWVIRRYRLHEAAAQATEGGDVDWARLAIALGYYDQAHLVRDFTATVGTAPARYAAAQDQ